MALLSVSELHKKYSNVPVLDKINFEIQRGEFVSVFGPNGCGKTTLLNILSGLDKNYSGSVHFSEEQTKRGFIFQNSNDSVLPWKSVLNNLKLDNQTIDYNKIKDVLEDLKLWEHKNKFPYQLSGGMKQLLAIARSFIFGCNILFLDEPFSSLDYSMAQTARERLLNLWQKDKPTIFFVSHDVEETILLSDRIILLSKRPARIKKIIDIKLPRPRDRTVETSNEFLEYKKLILAEIENEI